MSEHTDLIDAVNDAKTQHAHDAAYWRLQGWRDGITHCGHRWDFIEADQHTESRFPGRPYCCGVLLDWSPSSAA